MALGLTEAAEGLRDYFGPRLDASRSEGPDIMRDALVEKFHLSKDEAKKIVDDLVKAGSVKWMSSGNAATGSSGGAPDNPAIAGTQGGVTGLPLGAAEEMRGGINSGGYWTFK